MKIELQKNFDTRKEAEIFNEFIAGFGSKCIKSVYCCFVNVIFIFEFKDVISFIDSINIFFGIYRLFLRFDGIILS